MSLFGGKDKAYDRYSDEDLIAEFRSTADSRCCGVLYQRYGHLVLGLCIKYLRRKEEAEDAVMQIFSKLFDDLHKHKVTFFKSWLYVYSKNHCLMELRKRQSRLKRDLEMKEELPLIMDFSVDAHLKEREEQILLMEQAIETLNEAQRTCVRLFYLQQLSYNEISKKTGYSNKDVKSHIQNGKRNLKIKLEAQTNEKPEDQ